MKTVLVLILATLAAAVGEAFIARGMKQMGDVSLLGIKGLWKSVGMFTHPLVLLGIAFTILFFVLFTWALSWSDLSFAQPLTALSFVFGTLIAKYFLNEDVSFWRWLGVLVIVFGVFLITRDPKQLTPGGGYSPGAAGKEGFPLPAAPGGG
ncbi:MAG: DMT family transporter [Elusimicrobia bacterium]|nr:DMT family transporter [Elusimicrobiota bacterium]